MQGIQLSLTSTRWGYEALKKIIAGVVAAGILLVPAAAVSSAAAATVKKSTAVVVAPTADNRLYVDVNPDKGRGFWNIKVQRWNGKKWVTKKNYRTQGAQETRTTAKLPEGTYRVIVKPKYGHKGTTSGRVVLPGAGANPPTVVPGSFAGEGTFQVGTQVPPGLYRSTSSDFGYWERLSGAGGTLDEILANDNVTGQAYVQIAPTDAYFRTTRMQRWVPVDPSVPGPQATSFAGDGTFMVGVDIAPGTYQTTAVDFGYWARLSGASGTLDEIIANDNAPSGSQVIVTIQPTDRFFRTSRMGTWTKIG